MFFVKSLEVSLRPRGRSGPLDLEEHSVCGEILGIKNFSSRKHEIKKFTTRRRRGYGGGSRDTENTEKLLATDTHRLTQTVRIA
jgi:hypothetical protein